MEYVEKSVALLLATGLLLALPLIYLSSWTARKPVKVENPAD